MSKIPFSVLDLSPIVEGGGATQSFRNTLDLAQRTERLGFNRYWLAEHHSMPGVGSAATAVLIAYVGAGTSTIRIGAGGIMLPNHAPLIIAEQFGTLESLYPGRVDLGLGRAPGSDYATARAIRRDLNSDPERFPQDVMELMSYFHPHQPLPVRAIPGEGLNIPIWILGSSLFGAQVAAALGLPFAFASHFAPAQMMEAISLYRSRFQPSQDLEAPYVMLGYGVYAAETDEEAKLLATSVQQAFVNLRSGRPTPLQPPRAGFYESLPSAERAMLDQALACSAVGSRPTVHRELAAFIARTEPDELIVTSQIYDHAARVRSYEILAAARDLID
jgi:luciferase family oxidoreductase group 1